jgi:Trypsin-like serine proteases, typically periplasmic, contain C-terminal PDZ domain
MIRKSAFILIAILALAPAVAMAEQTSALGLEAQVEAVYNQASPSVVNITSSIVGQDAIGGAVPQEGTGSGFVYDLKGHIVTNYHVVANADKVTVSFDNGKSYKASVIGKDSSNDLAVLAIPETAAASPLPLADSKSLKVGQFVVALGNPFGLDRTLTFGVISALGRVIQSPDGRFIGEAIQTDAPINPGNSGGPLLDLEGRVIGINSQIMSGSGSSAGIGFAIPSRIVQKVVPQLIARGKYSHPWLGVRGLDISTELSGALGDAGFKLGSDAGMLVLDVVKGSPAAKAGVLGGSKSIQLGGSDFPVGGDVIVAINGKPISGFQDLTLYLESQTNVDDNVALKIIRGGVTKVLQVSLTERPEQP